MLSIIEKSHIMEVGIIIIIHIRKELAHMTKWVQLVQDATKYLANVCDGASTEDGNGFNKIDSGFGRSLAGQAVWTKKQTIAAAKMLKKYKGQLTRAGFNVAHLFETKPEELQEAFPEPKPVIKEEALPNKTAVLMKNGSIRIEFLFDWAVLEIVKAIPNRRFHGDSKEKYWTAPVSKEAIEILSNAGFDMDSALLPTLKVKEITMDDVSENDVEIKGLKKDLFDFQKKGVAFIEAKGGRALVGDEMGLGKTIQALAWLQLHPENRPAIILVPAHLKLNWAQEIASTITSKTSTYVAQGTYKGQPVKEDIIIINFDILHRGWLEALQALNAKALIIDEAHYIKSNKAIRTKATKKLAKTIPHIIGLTGTPIINRPAESYNIIQLIDKTIFPNFMKFVHNYCDAKHNGFGWDYSGSSNTGELHEKLKEIMIRRKKADVLPDLPDKLRSYVPMELDNQKEYKLAESDFIEYLLTSKGEEAAEKASQAEHLVRIEALKQLAVQGKMKHTINWISDFLENNGQKLVVFSTHKIVVDKLMETFGNVAVKVDGSVSSIKRNEAVQAFQNDPKVRLFVGNIQAAGTGLTLTAASSVAFVELPWTPGELAQAEDRCHRIGQKNTVNIYYLLAKDTIEGDVIELLDEKRLVLDAVLDGQESDQSSLFSALIEKYENK